MTLIVPVCAQLALENPDEPASSHETLPLPLLQLLLEEIEKDTIENEESESKSFMPIQPEVSILDGIRNNADDSQPKNDLRARPLFLLYCNLKLAGPS